MANPLNTTFVQCKVVTILLAVCSLVLIVTSVIIFFGPLRELHPLSESGEHPISASPPASDDTATTELSGRTKTIFLFYLFISFGVYVFFPI